MLSEDNVAGKISDERFGKLSKNYEQEQGEIGKRIKALRSELKKENNRQYTADTFLDIVCRYTGADALAQRMVTELINHIDVYHAERVNGEIMQEVKIYYNCIGGYITYRRFIRNSPQHIVYNYSARKIIGGLAS